MQAIVGAVLSYLAAIASLLTSLAWLYAIANIVQTMRSLNTPKDTTSIRSSPVSIVIAARNEAHNLKILLPILLDSKHVAQVVLVDDNSTDDTPELAKELSIKYGDKLTYTRLNNTPPGWSPKSYALYTGAKHAKGDVLFFIDADVRILHLDKALSIVASTPPDKVLAFVPRFYCKGAICKASEAVMTGLAYGFYGLHKVMDKKKRLAWLYGCCWAIHKNLYERLGGHSAVRNSIVEDRAFASHVKRNNIDIVFIDARDFIYVKAYEDIAGYSSLIARLSVEPLAKRSTAAKVLFVLLVTIIIYSPILLAFLATYTAPLPKLILVLPILAQLATYGYGAFIEGYNPLYAIPALLAQSSILIGLIHALRSRVYWKGRRVA